ncbi:hypothetical protein Trydic_g5005 [Trypoxylus dichotomus]
MALRYRPLAFESICIKPTYRVASNKAARWVSKSSAPKPFIKDLNPNSFDVGCFVVEDVLEAHDGLSSFPVRNCNLSLRISTFPTYWRLGRITSLQERQPRSGSRVNRSQQVSPRSNCVAYRPKIGRAIVVHSNNRKGASNDGKSAIRNVAYVRSRNNSTSSAIGNRDT